jgi:hypothetical protein
MTMREPLIAHDATQTITAGGIVARSAKLAEELRTSPVTARTYAHPALDGKVVVRLEPDAVAAGTDAEMAAFGFAAPAVSSPLGQVRYRTLGFPAWALVHEPKKAKVALDVTEDVRKAKRLVAAKPGHAKEAFEKIAKQLQRQAPQFLPSFWEEVGRVVADQASSSMAAQCFERARQAERAYKLKTDPEDADAVMVEFALLGALSAKTLSQYAKDLTKSAGGKEAYRRFRAIVVKRALGGMPPYSGMGKDLRALAGAADLDVEREEDALVGELIDAPGVGKAPVEFWTTYRGSIERLAKARPELRTRLRAIWPDPRGGNDDTRKAFKASWLELLAEVGALGDLPDDGLGAWVSRMIRYAGKTERVESVLRGEAERLRQLNQRVAVVAPARWSTDLSLDLAELVLSLGVELEDPPRWDDFLRDDITCDPVRVADHPKYKVKLVELVAHMMGESEHEHKMRGKAGFTAARRQWIEQRLDKLGAGALTEIESELEEVDSKTAPETFVPFPELHDRLMRIDLSRALARQLRGGIADEFGWPAYEAAFATLGDTVRIGGAFPVMTAWNKTKAIAIDASGVIAEHDLVYKPKEHSIEHVFWLGGQFLVVLDPESGWQNVAYWSGSPKQRFDFKAGIRMWGGNQPTAWTLPDGSVTLGGKSFRPGDTTISDSCDYLCDGNQMWIEDGDKLFLFDPVAGKKAGEGAPAWVSEFAAEGWKVDKSSCVLVPAPAGVTSSPLGQRDGLLGLRVRDKIVEKKPAANDDDDDTPVPQEAERIDGVRVKRQAFAYCTFPGDMTPRRIEPDNVYQGRYGDDSGPAVELYDPAEPDTELCEINAHVWAARGWGAVHVPPATFWDFLSPRDPAGSRVLRQLTEAQAGQILAAARRDAAAGGELGKRELAATEAAVRAVGIASDALVRGVAGVAEYAGELANKLADVAAARSKEHADPGGQGLVGEAAQLRKLATALAAGKKTKLKDFDVDPREWLRFGRAKAALALSPIADEDDRRKARDFVRAVSGTILADDLSRVRILELEAPDDYDSDEWSTVQIEPIEGSVFAIETNDTWAIELSTDGTFRVPPPWKITEEVRLGRGIGTAWADAYGDLPDEAVEWDPAIAEKIAARADLSIPEATLLYCGMPGGWGRDFLGKQKRDVLGLKMGEADAARTTFEELDSDKKLALVGAAVPDDPRLLVRPLDPGGFAERLGDTWKAKFGKRAKIPQDLIAAAKKDLPCGDELGAILPAFAGAHDDAWFLKPDLRSIHELGGWRDDKGLTIDKAGELAMVVGWLFANRPVGDPIRAGIPVVVERLREVLDDERVLFKLEDHYYDDEDQKQVARATSIVDMVGGKPTKLPKDGDDECLDARDDGAIIVGRFKSNVIGAWRPAQLDKSRKRVEQLAQAMQDSDDSYGDPLKPFKLIALVRSDGFGAFAERVRDTPVPEGQYEANPLAAAPKLVAKVVKELGISEEAATLYLQTLALAEPTQRNVCLWNGWKPKQYQTAAAELVKKKLVMEGKRERAGRTIFVKGGYTKGDKKNLPLEEWKLPFYSGVLDRNVPAEPCHLLFFAAWKRIDDGEKPA